MPTVTYLGNDANLAKVKWCNPMTLEEFEFTINVPVNVDPEAPENAKRKALAKHIIDKLRKVPAMSQFYRLDDDAPKAAEPAGEPVKIDGRTKKARAAKAAEQP